MGKLEKRVDGYNAERESELKEQTPMPVIAKLRFKAVWRVLDGDWAELTLWVKFREGWLPLLPPDLPMLVARRAHPHKIVIGEQVLAVIHSAFRKYLPPHPVVFGKAEIRAGDGVNDYRFWATFSGEGTIGILTSKGGLAHITSVW